MVTRIMINNSLKTSRCELKYLISDAEYFALANRIKHLLPQDQHVKANSGYFIRSLYFDSHNNLALHEKQAGVMLRKKIRMRIYDLSSEEVKFEIKHRLNNNIFKETAFISKATAQKVIKGDYTDLLNYNNDILNRIYATFTLGDYRPKTIIDYNRDAFTLNFCNIRITIDKNIRANNSSPNLFSKELQMLPIMFENKHVLEIKFDKILPNSIRNLLQLKTFERVAFSKYVLGRRMLKQEMWEDN